MPLQGAKENENRFLGKGRNELFIEGYRALIIKGALPDWKGLLWVSFLGVFMAAMGYLWFMKTKKAFADVI